MDSYSVFEDTDLQSYESDSSQATAEDPSMNKGFVRGAIECKSSMQLTRHVCKLPESMARNCSDAGSSRPFPWSPEERLGMFFYNNLANVFSVELMRHYAVVLMAKLSRLSERTAT